MYRDKSEGPAKLKLDYGVILVLLLLLLLGTVSAAVDPVLIADVNVKLKKIQTFLDKQKHSEYEKFQSGVDLLSAKKNAETALTSYETLHSDQAKAELISAVAVLDKCFVTYEKAFAHYDGLLFEASQCIVGAQKFWAETPKFRHYQLPSNAGLEREYEKLKAIRIECKAHPSDDATVKLESAIHDLKWSLRKCWDDARNYDSKTAETADDHIKEAENQWNKNVDLQKFKIGSGDLIDFKKKAENAYKEYQMNPSKDTKIKLESAVAHLDSSVDNYKRVAQSFDVKTGDSAVKKIKEVKDHWDKNGKFQKFQSGAVLHRAMEHADRTFEYYQDLGSDTYKKELESALNGLDAPFDKFKSLIARFDRMIAGFKKELDKHPNSDGAKAAKIALDDFADQPSKDNEEVLKTAFNALGWWGSFKNMISWLYSEYPKTSWGITGSLNVVSLAGLGWIGGSRFPIPFLKPEPKPEPIPVSQPPTLVPSSSEKGPDKKSGDIWTYAGVIGAVVAVVAIMIGLVWFCYFRGQPKDNSGGGSKASDGGEKGEDSKKASSASGGSSTGAGSKASTTARSTTSKASDTVASGKPSGDKASTGASSSGKPRGSSKAKAEKTSS